ncbi:MAG TPA: hypothetical protein VEJ84_06085 [Acidimicrobiales bacterium]|nr:hypothetical protein [Acidimicrobiales bacterium]
MKAATSVGVEARPYAGPEAFQVVLVRPPGYVHAAALNEVAESVYYGLRSLGVNATLAVNHLVVPGPPILLFGAHLLKEQEAAQVPDSTIIYNLEQVSPESTWTSPVYMSLLRRCPIWDYSARNLEALAELGITSRTKHVPVGYVPELTRIEPSPTQDIDVLFYGSVNDRRARALTQVKARGLNVQAIFGVYGSDRDELIARSKVVLNLHFYESSIFELVRVSYLLANRKAVVAECHPRTEIDPEIATAVRLATYEGLADACVELVADTKARRELERRALAAIAARPETVYLARALRTPDLADLGQP